MGLYKGIAKFALAAILVIGIAAALYFSFRPKKEEISVGQAEIADIRSFATLCSMDFYNETPIIDTIHSRVLVGIQKQRGSILFPLDDLSIDPEADTIRISLPKERIELFEAADPDSWRVVDTKYIGPLPLLHSDTMPLKDENIIKSRAMRKSRQALYRDGTVLRARRHAAHTLADLLSKLYRRPAIVSYPTR